MVGNPLYGQGGLLKKVAKSMTNELLGKPQEADAQPEPNCACDNAQVIFSLGGKLQLDYSEVSISTREDGAILIKDVVSGNFYISKDGSTQGPIRAGDKRLEGFENNENYEDKDPWTSRYGQYITRQGEKYLITFGGKIYGPYAVIQAFALPKSKDKFAALVVENIYTMDDQTKKIDAAMKNAKTDQERIDIAMKYSQQMINKVPQYNDGESLRPKVISSVPNIKFDPMKQTLATVNGEMKYDEILLVDYEGTTSDLMGNKIITLKPEYSASKVFISSNNSRYAVINYGEMIFSDNNTKLAEFFNPYLLKSDGKINLAYMYYSPKKNAIMQCKIPF